MKTHEGKGKMVEISQETVGGLTIGKVNVKGININSLYDIEIS